MVQAGGAPVVTSAPTACQVQCAGCRRILNVPSGILNFQCPKCKLPQVLPPQLRSQGLARGIDNTKIQLPCANCRAVLNVPPGLTRFVCPQCRVELAVDPVKLAAYMSSLSQLNVQLNGSTNGQGAAPPTVSLPGDAMDDAVWNANNQLQGASGFALEEINEVLESHPAIENYLASRLLFFPGILDVVPPRKEDIFVRAVIVVFNLILYLQSLWSGRARLVGLFQE